VSDRLPDSFRDRAAYRHWTPVQVRFRDLDLLGHVNNVNLAGWFEDARVALELPIQPLVPNYGGPILVLAELRIRYLAEVHHGAEIRIGTGVERLGRTSVTFGQAVFVGATCAAIARSVEVLIDHQTRAPTPFPREFVTVFEPYLLDHPDPPPG
jgi:acyl-CoA thioester hydrolase